MTVEDHLIVYDERFSEYGLRFFKKGLDRGLYSLRNKQALKGFDPGFDYVWNQLSSVEKHGLWNFVNINMRAACPGE